MRLRLLSSLVVAVAIAIALRPDVSAQTDQQTVAFGTKHGVALRNNGDVLTWGDNVFCQLGRITSGNVSATPELVMRNVKEIAVASSHTLALTTDGKVYVWGNSDSGALGMGDENEQCEGPALVPSLAGKTIGHIATGANFSLALTTGGDLFCTGDNTMSQCPAAPANGKILSFAAMPNPELAGKVVGVRAGSFHALALTREGSLYAFGRGRDGQLGGGRTVNGFGLVPDLTGVVSFAAGTWHSVAARADGSVWAWGNDAKSQLCDGTTTNRATPTRIASLPAGAKIAQVVAGGHDTLMRATDGALYACGDNQFGSLGADRPSVLGAPTPIAQGTTLAGLTAGGGVTAFSTDGCAVRIAGYNENVVVSATAGSGAQPFSIRAGLSLCGPRPASPLATLVREFPKGGESGCWAPRQEEDAAGSQKFAPLRQAMLAAESMLKQNAAFLAAPVPVRFRTSLSAGPLDESGARMHVKAAPERKMDGTRLWSAGCGIIPQLDRIGGAITQISVFFNNDARGQFISPTGEPPKRTGIVAGFPEYNHWVLITKDGRLPWIPQTLADKLDAESARRRSALADWLKTRSQMKLQDPASVQQTYEMLKKSDPAGADKYRTSMQELAEEAARLQKDVYPATTAELEKKIKDLDAYRASFTPAQLAAPAVFGDPSGEGKRQLNARIAALQALTADEQRQVDEWTRDSRALERQAQVETTNKNAAEAARLRAQSNALANNVRTLRQRHLERAGPLMDDANAQYEVTNLRPGGADQAISAKPDPSFPDFKTPNRIQVIAILFSVDPDPRQTVRLEWQRRIKDTFDFAALAALLK